MEPGESWPPAPPPQVNGQSAGPRPRKTGARRKVRVDRGRGRGKGGREIRGAERAASLVGPPPARGLSRRRLRAPLVRRRQLLLPRSLGWRAPARERQAAPKLGQMTARCPRPVLGRFFPPSLSSVFNGARRARPGAEAAGLSRPGPPLDPTPRGSVLLPALRLLSSGRNLSRGGRGSSNVGAQAGSTRFPRRGEAGSPAGGPRARLGAGERAGGPAGPEEDVRLRAVGRGGGRAASVAREPVHSNPLIGEGSGFLFGDEGKAIETATGFRPRH